MIPTSTYLMWYNVIPYFVHLDPNLYPIYQIGAKGFDYSIFKNYTSYVIMEIHMEEIHPKEIRMESHLLIHMLDLLDGQHNMGDCVFDIITYLLRYSMGSKIM
jgi:hypothetical protein